MAAKAGCKACRQAMFADLTGKGKLFPKAKSGARKKGGQHSLFTSPPTAKKKKAKKR